MVMVMVMMILMMEHHRNAIPKMPQSYFTYFQPADISRGYGSFQREHWNAISVENAKEVGGSGS